MPQNHIAQARAAAVQALSSPELARIVDLVAYPEPAPGHPTAVVVENVRGAVRLHRDGRHEVLRGEDPVANTDPMAFLPYERELADASPDNERNAYPDPARRLLGIFSDADRSPDLVIVHHPGHYFPDEGGHRGEHGSLDVIQSRAPLLVAGAGVTKHGMLDEHAFLIDVGPTMAAAAGVPLEDLRDAAGNQLDGKPLTHLVEPGRRRVVGLLWDGAHCGELLAMAGRGDLPSLGRLLQRGAALRGGAVAEFPSLTLTNHTSILTGLGPGRHGVMGNVFYDRATGDQVVPNDASTWHRSSEWLRPKVRTVFDMVGQHRGELPVPTASINEAIDEGAAYSTMGLIRAQNAGEGAAGLGALLPDPTTSPYVHNRRHLQYDYFSWATQVDDVGLAQVLQLWARPEQAPALTWWATVVTDAGHHGGGPRSEMARDAFRDADARLAVLLDHLESEGVLDDVTFVLTADHGFEGADVNRTGSWTPALTAALEPFGIGWRDEGPGFVYLGVGDAPVSVTESTTPVS
ncbi:MAG TPA: alkaline phosphatase family protein [Actinomycetales bacterium]|nr:alkaline phosphatase family protein [Actinomycetales bacterium]